MRTEKEKAEEILKERDRARKGFAVTDDEGKDPLKGSKGSPSDAEEREKKVEDAGLVVGLGMKRS